MSFFYPALTLGFLLVLAPLLIHLINMMRHRRVEWAAMEFLLQSYKKHRKWVWLKQLLLLLARMAALAILVAMLAKWTTSGDWMDLFGGKATHHYVLLDDSYSLSERKDGKSAYEDALDFVQRLGNESVKRLQSQGRQKFTLIRFSQAAGMQDDLSVGDVGSLADMNAEIVDNDFGTKLQDVRNQFEVTETSVGPRQSIEMVKQLLAQNTEENRAVYLVSDFRENEWEAPADIATSLSELDKTGADIHFIRCAKEVHDNLAVTDLSPADDTRAAGVPLFMNVTIKNYGTQSARNVQLTIRTFFHAASQFDKVTPDDLVGEPDEIFLPPIEEIGPGKSLTTRVQVYFPQAGQHVVQAELKDGDAIKVDNSRWCVVDFPEGEKVLIVDGSGESRHSYYLESAFRPGATTLTGVQPETTTDATYLRDISQDELRKFSSIYLVDVGTLEGRAIRNLEGYVESGGGLCIFVGDEVNARFYNNNLYKDGEGLLPMPLSPGKMLGVKTSTDEPDVLVSDHPVFDVFSKERDPIVNRVTVELYMPPTPEFDVKEHPTVTVAASLRDGQPLALEKTFGQGRVILFTTTVAPDWNDWGLNPFLVVVGLKLQSYLAAPQRVAPDHNVAAPIDVSLQMERYQNKLKFFLPADAGDEREEIELIAEQGANDSRLMLASLGKTKSGSASRETANSGIYDAALTNGEGSVEIRRFAVNLDADEGDLSLVDQQQMLTKLAPVEPTVRFADQYSDDIIQQAGLDRSMMLMALLILLLVGEQMLAYSASYHPVRR